MVLYTTKFDMDEQEATLLERFFSHDELEATKVESQYWVEGLDPKPNPDWVGSALVWGLPGRAEAYTPFVREVLGIKSFSSQRRLNSSEV